MKTITLSDFRGGDAPLQEMTAALESGKLACFPTPSGYKLAADLSSVEAVTAMLQAKRRVKNAPSLVLVSQASWVDKLASSVSSDAQKLMEAFWPGPLTLLFSASDELPDKVRKALTKAKGWIGVRLPDDEVSAAVVKRFQRPLLVSSANLAQKGGANSVAQVRKNFGRTVEIMIDAGDLSGHSPSTLVDVRQGESSIVRMGALSQDAIQTLLTVPNPVFAQNES